MLKISDLCASIEQKMVVRNLSLQVEPGSVHAIMGPNGSGKSSLAHVLMGHPLYTVKKGTITFDGQDITQWAADKRARAGLFISFQHPYAIPGVTIKTFLKEACYAIQKEQLSVADFDKTVVAACEVLSIPLSFINRSLNDGFSGGEKKKLEMLQLLMLKPRLAILDEIDSGLDVDALKVVAQGITYAQKINPAMSIVLITHYQRILHYVVPEFVHILHGGTIIQSGDAALALRVENTGYDTLVQQAV